MTCEGWICIECHGQRWEDDEFTRTDHGPLCEDCQPVEPEAAA